ncbi:MAG: PIN domain-containing protein [Fimbriimonadales bacterium]|nr:PIN domain-containing protein [Fimbriimonadales bacterium]
MKHYPMLLDTSGLLCVLDKSETRHSIASSLFDSPRPKIVHSYVLAELIPLCRSRGVPAERAVEFSFALMSNPLVKVIWVDEAVHQAALLLIDSRRDKRYSLCDAVSFVLMRMYSIQEALTTDKHFEQEGFIRLLGE